jgi:hypothetical protein
VHDVLRAVPDRSRHGSADRPRDGLDAVTGREEALGLARGGGRDPNAVSGPSALLVDERQQFPEKPAGRTSGSGLGAGSPGDQEVHRHSFLHEVPGRRVLAHDEPHPVLVAELEPHHADPQLRAPKGAKRILDRETYQGGNWNPLLGQRQPSPPRATS